MSYSARFLRMWNESSSNFPEGLTCFLKKDQRIREQKFEVYLRKIKDETNVKEFNYKLHQMENLRSLLTGFFQEILGFSANQLQVILSDDMVRSTFDFIKAARTYDPEISFHDIFQACRNVWIMNGLQFLMGHKICLTPAVFAYSMLYPYTDNFLDNPEISYTEKMDFSSRFSDRLAGKNISALNENEGKIFRLVGIIERFWNRGVFPKVYESLLAIHDAQTKSLRLIVDPEFLNIEEIFTICIQKGGISVVADGYLIGGNLTKEWEEFFYSYGAYLQLLDDLQDVNDDFNDSLMTGFSSLAKKEVLDAWLSKTYNLGIKLMADADRLQAGNNSVFKSLMNKSIDLFLVESVVTNSQFFSSHFVKKFEAFSPLSFSFIKQQKGALSPYQDRLFERFLHHSMLDQTEFPLEFLNKKSLSNDQQAL